MRDIFDGMDEHERVYREKSERLELYRTQITNCIIAWFLLLVIFWINQTVYYKMNKFCLFAGIVTFAIYFIGVLRNRGKKVEIFSADGEWIGWNKFLKSYIVFEVACIIFFILSILL